VAWRHTAEQVRLMREAGVSVLSYYIANDTQFDTKAAKKAFGQMYGKSASYINPENVLEIAGSLNNLFLRRS
jgi:hypothetical protein